MPEPFFQSALLNKHYKAALLFLGQNTNFITTAMDCKTILSKATDRFDPAKIDTANRVAPDFNS